jgi:hypothetical protein
VSRAAIALKRPVEAGPVLAYLQECRRAHRNKSRWDRFTDAYTVFLFAALGGYLAFAALRESPISPAEAVPVIDELARWAPPVLLLLLVASLRYCTWQGPVLFSLPDVEWLLSAPLSHVEIVRRRLRRGLAIAAGLGAALGLATFVVVEAELGVPAWPLFGATVGGLVTLGLLAGAAGWLIECSPKRARIVLRASPLVVPVAAALALAPSVADGDVVLWSGPWGWAAAPIIATAGGSAPSWPYQATLLAVAALASVAIAWRSAGSAPTEELARRAGIRSGLVAALYFVDVRGAALLVRRAGESLVGIRRVRLRRPRSSRLAVLWRDALSTLRAPGRIGWALLLTVAGALAVVAAPDRRAVVAASVLAGYVAAAQLCEPLRLEADQPDAHHVLPWRWGDLLLLHCAVPVLSLTVLGVLAVGVASLAGLLPAAAVWSALALCPLVAATFTSSAAIAGQRGPFPIELLLLGGDAGAVALLVWLATGPILAALALILPVSIVYGAADDGSLVAEATGAASAVLVVTLLAAVAFLRSRRQPE